MPYAQVVTGTWPSKDTLLHDLVQAHLLVLVIFKSDIELNFFSICKICS